MIPPTPDVQKLQKLWKSSSKIVLAGGVFDIIHPGHINTLNTAKKLGGSLVVVVATDKTAVKMKKRKPLHSAKLRQELVSSLSMVDLCIIGNEENIFSTVELVRPNIIALGYDQTHQEKYITEGCRKIKLEVTVVRLESPRPETSSSSIQKEYGKDIHDL
ncbi:MAG TPA: adenylyltransferase/cytidyltransferase family protein, partial [Candidatus Nitrosopelagicus sp.]|jgi:cytidyltransferase-like protein|nr:adenylyltransferase/cytidyltransferase family protein [Candidatus Nitrosopelagicus sp.]